MYMHAYTHIYLLREAQCYTTWSSLACTPEEVSKACTYCFGASGSRLLGHDVGALIIRIRFWGIVSHNYDKEAPELYV